MELNSFILRLKPTHQDLIFLSPLFLASENNSIGEGRKGKMKERRRNPRRR